MGAPHRITEYPRPREAPAEIYSKPHEESLIMAVKTRGVAMGQKYRQKKTSTNDATASGGIQVQVPCFGARALGVPRGLWCRHWSMLYAVLCSYSTSPRGQIDLRSPEVVPDPEEGMCKNKSKTTKKFKRTWNFLS